MSNFGRRRRSRNPMLVPNLPSKVVPYGPRLLPGLIVRPDRRLVEICPPLQPAETRSAAVALSERGPYPGDPRPMASFPQREGFLALCLLSSASLLPHPLLPEPAQPAHPCPGARIACLAAGPCPRALRTFCRLPRDGHNPRSGRRASEGVPQGTFRRAGELREMSLQDRVGLRVQSCVGGRPRRGGHGFRLGPSQLRRAAHRGSPHSLRPPRRLPGRQGLLLAGVGASLAGGPKSFGRRHAQGQQPSVVVGGGSTLGGRQAAGHRAGDLPVEGLLRFGASPGEDSGRPVGSFGSQDRSLHLRTVAEPVARSPTASSGRPLGLNTYASAVLGDGSAVEWGRDRKGKGTTGASSRRDEPPHRHLAGLVAGCTLFGANGAKPLALGPQPL